MKKMMKKLVLFSFAALLAACTADELSTVGGSVSPPTGETVTSGTVKFTNNTSMTIGSGAATVAKRGKEFDVPENLACSLDMPDAPAQEVIDAAGTPLTNYTMTLGNLTKPMAVGENGVVNINTLSSSSTIYVLKGGKVVVDGTCSGGGSIVVLDGGTLEYKANTLSGFKVYNYGGTVTVSGSLVIAPDAEFYTSEDLDMTGHTLTVNGKCYVGGNLACNSLGSETEDALVHVIGDVDVNGGSNGANAIGSNGTATFTGKCHLCVEGGLMVYSLTASQGAQLHTGCKLVATDPLNSSVNITNGAVLCAAYIETELLHISGGMQGAHTTVSLSDGGVINVNRLSLGNNMSLIPYNSAKSLVSAKTITIEGGVKWENVIDGELYVNYETVWADADPVDTSRHNISSLKWMPNPIFARYG